jgi:hypothetical protein
MVREAFPASVMCTRPPVSFQISHVSTVPKARRPASASWRAFGTCSRIHENFAGGKISVDQQAGFLLNQIFVALRFELLAKRGRAAILPDNGVAEGPASCAVPHDSSFALVGDSNGSHVARLHAGLRQSIEGNGDLRRCDFFGIVLDPARFRENLSELALGYGADRSTGVKQESSGARRTLIERKDVTQRGLLFFCARLQERV